MNAQPPQSAAGPARPGEPAGAVCAARALKQQLRRQAASARQAQPDKGPLSELICRSFAAQTEYAAARTLMLYLSARSEVRTRPLLTAAIAAGKQVVVPYCVGSQLDLFLLDSPDELAPGSYGIPEPRPELRALPGKRVDPARIDLVMVPGVAFDRRGGRLGHGRGYYDRFLPRLRIDALAIGVAFECQLVPEVPMLSADVFMDRVITERAVYPGRGRSA
jgi:5-formyltetrahydrofolate cyclo-ligase